MNFPPNTEKHTSETQFAVVKTDRVQTDRVCLCVSGRESYSYPVPATGHHE